MVVGILQVELTMAWSQSLKDKRRVVSSLKDRLHREHQIAVAEVGTLDNRRTAQLGMAVVSTSVPHCQQMLDRVLEKLRTARDCVLSDHRLEILTGQ